MAAAPTAFWHSFVAFVVNLLFSAPGKIDQTDPQMNQGASKFRVSLTTLYHLLVNQMLLPDKSHDICFPRSKYILGAVDLTYNQYCKDL